MKVLGFEVFCLTIQPL